MAGQVMVLGGANFDPNSVSVHALGTNGSNLIGTANGYQYTRVPKADGGADYYRLGGDNYTDVRAISEADAMRELGWNPASETTTGGTSYYSGGGSGSGTDPALSRAYYNGQIESINRLLGVTDTQERAGLDNLATQRDRLGKEEADTMKGYLGQETENMQDKERNLNTVDTYARDNLNSLRRLLQGANAGNSAVGQTLIPYLISKSAGVRRQNAFDTFGKNAKDIDTAEEEATKNYGYAREDLGKQDETFRSGIQSKRNELLGQRQQYEIARDNGYSPAAMGTQSDIDSRINTLNELFGKYASYKYNPVESKVPELGRYTVDKAAIGDSTQPRESSFYLNQILQKKKQDQLVA